MNRGKKQMIQLIQKILAFKKGYEYSNDEIQNNTPNDIENDLESQTCKECDFVASKSYIHEEPHAKAQRQIQMSENI